MNKEELKLKMKDIYAEGILKLMPILKDYRVFDEVTRKYAKEGEPMGDTFKRLSLEQVHEIWDSIKFCSFRENPNPIVSEMNVKLRKLNELKDD